MSQVHVLNKVAAKDKKQAAARPENAFTTQEYATHIGIGVNQAAKRLKSLAETGAVQSIYFEVETNRGYIRKQPGWQLIDESTTKTQNKT